MSSKINVKEILSGHFRTLTNSSGKISVADLVTFFLVPVILGGLPAAYGCNLSKDLVGLLVNFGSILTALLLSVLVLVYDQESKLDPRREPSHDAKKRLLKDLYFNISFSIIGAMTLVVLCFVHTAASGVYHDVVTKTFNFRVKYDVLLLSPAIIFISSNLLLNIVMIVKRLHSLLITRN
jgi:hypothetical protein